MAKERYKRFLSAAVGHFRGVADLVTLTGHASTDIRIFYRGGATEAPMPCLIVTPFPINHLVPDVDGYYVNELVLQAFSKNALTTMDIIGAAEESIKQSASTHRDQSFSGTGVSGTMRSLGSVILGEPTADQESDVYVSELRVEARWREA